MAQITKIYELKTLGYNEVIQELENIDKVFKSIKASKQDLNKTKSKTDPELDRIAAALKQEKINTMELRLERQKLLNEGKALLNAKTAEINKRRENSAAIKAETGSLTDLIAKRKQLQALINAQNPNSTGNILFGGNTLTRNQALAQITALNGQIAALQTGMGNVGTIGNQVNNALAAGFNRMKGSLGSMILMYTGWFAAFREAGRLIGENIKLSDTFADLQIRIKGTREETEALFEQLKQIDTRTSLNDLVNIAGVVAKKGVTNDLAALVAEFDKLNVVLGAEMGQPDTAAANVIKLITIFNDDKSVTAERINEIAVSLFKLTTTGVATGEYLVNFAERVGAVRGITGLTLPSILGMGAALQQLGQRTELASTAAVQLSTKIFANIPKFANAARMSIEEFRAALDKDPFEALVAVAEGLKDIGSDELAAEFEEVVVAFGEVGITGARVKAVLGDIATNADYVRNRMRVAIATAKDYEAQTAALNIKQQTFAATLDRIRKELEQVSTNLAVRTTLEAIAGIILVVVGNIGTLITVLAAWSAVWLVANSSMVIARISTIALNVAITAQYAALVIGQTFMRAYTAALLLFTGATNGASRAMVVFNTILRANPLGVVITLFAALTAALTFLFIKLRGTTAELKKHTEQQYAYQEATRMANEATAEQITELETLVKIITNVNTSAEVQVSVLDKLISKHQLFASVIKDGIIEQDKLIAVLGKVREEILLNAKATASAQLTAEKYKDYLQIVSLRQKIETETGAQDGGFKKVTGITKEEEELLKNLTKSTTARTSGGILGISTPDIPNVINKLTEMQEKAYDSYLNYITVSAVLEGQVKETQQKNEKIITEAADYSLDARIKRARTSLMNELELDALLDSINTALKHVKEGDAKLKILHAAKEEFLERLRKLKNEKGPREREYRGARIPGATKDDLSEVDALMNTEIAIEKERFAQLQIQNRATFEEEIEHVENLKEIQQRYLKQKIAIFESEKTLNAKEKETLAKFKEDVASIELQSIEQIQTIRDRQFNLERRNLKAILDNQIDAINLRTKEAELDASLSYEQRAEIRLKADEEILGLQVKFNENIDLLEKKLNQRTRENALQGAKTREQIMQDTINLFNARLRDAETAGDRLENEFRIRAAEQTVKILESGKSPTVIARELQELQNKLSRDLLASQLAQQKIELDLFRQGKDSKIKSEAEYQQKLREYQEAEAAFTKENLETQLTVYEKFTRALKDFGDSFAENVLGIKRYTDDAQGDAEKYRDAVLDAQNSIRQASDEVIRNYFDNQAARIDRERDVHRERLDREEEEVKARAQSQAEIDSIDKQYEEKRRQLDRQAGEEKKRLALKELAINFAMFILKSLAQYGLPLALLPIAGGTVLYAVQRANIQQQQFEEGGTIPRKGGKIRGRSHKHGGVKFNYEAEDEELMIINKRSAKDNKVYTITGTNRQIASKVNELGGGVAFSPGAQAVRKFAEGGFLGSNYSAPIYTPSSSSDSFAAEIRLLAIEQSKRIDRLEVIQVTDTVTEAQRKRVKQNSIGVLP